jgi:peptidoglycan/xylan/chitin deacetylase (PgdA/CDA1 family)
MNVSGIHHPIDRPRRTPLNSLKRTVKEAVKQTVTSRWMSGAWSPLIRDRAPFVMLHRFAEPENGLFGHDRELFRRALERLRRDGYAMLTVTEAVHRLNEGQGFPKRSVVFTMDDGYRGALEQSVDLFQAYDCPLTVFVTTGFIDGRCWLWWDQIEYVCLGSRRRSIDVGWNDSVVRLNCGDSRTTINTLLQTCDWCKTLPDQEKWRFIRALADAAEVEIPARAPAQYAPLTWSEMRAHEGRGITFGPHTVTHPILPQVDDRQVEWEIAESCARVNAEMARPVNVFAYPSGAYGSREIDVLARVGVQGAVTTRGAYASSERADTAGASRFAIPRFGYPETPDALMLIASGFKSIEISLAGLRAPNIAGGEPS